MLPPSWSYLGWPWWRNLLEPGLRSAAQNPDPQTTFQTFQPPNALESWNLVKDGQTILIFDQSIPPEGFTLLNPAASLWRCHLGEPCNWRTTSPRWFKLCSIPKKSAQPHPSVSDYSICLRDSLSIVLDVFLWLFIQNVKLACSKLANMAKVLRSQTLTERSWCALRCWGIDMTYIWYIYII